MVPRHARHGLGSAWVIRKPTSRRAFGRAPAGFAQRPWLSPCPAHGARRAQVFDDEPLKGCDESSDSGLSDSESEVGECKKEPPPPSPLSSSRYCSRSRA